MARADSLATYSLLDPGQLAGLRSNGLYTATAAQTQSLQTLEQKAVDATLHDHNLPASDAAAAQSWGRADVQAELWALVLEAIETAPAARSGDQQNVVDWLTTVEQRQAVQAAQGAGLEYVKWAGLDQTQYQQLLAT